MGESLLVRRGGSKLYSRTEPQLPGERDRMGGRNSDISGTNCHGRCACGIYLQVV